MPRALVLLAHGARDPDWAAPFAAIRERVAAARADLTVTLAFLELMQPSLEECIGRLTASGHERVVIAPLFLGMGGHLKRDLPRLLDAIRARHPGVELTTLPPIGEIEALVGAIAGELVNATPR